MRTFYIISGGTFLDVAPHFAVSARAFGTIGRQLLPLLTNTFSQTQQPEIRVQLILTRMALGGLERDVDSQALLLSAGISDLITNEDIRRLTEFLVADPQTRGIAMTAALTDFAPRSITINDAEEDVGLKRARLHSSDPIGVTFEQAPKLLPTIRAHRKDIFLVACKTTAGAEPDAQYLSGLSLVKRSSCNLVLANDLRTRLNMVITPEQARYHETTHRDEALQGLAEMIALRTNLHFTRATVVPGEAVNWGSKLIPDSLRTVVNHCIDRGAYKPFEGKTVGHFATRGPDDSILTSRRKTNFNELPSIGLVKIEPRGADEVIAHGFKPSVGGQSQRIIFTDHPETDCIVHMHCPLRSGSPIPVREQRPYECGSHECGKNTSDGLQDFGGIKAVMLDQHGPNIVFPRNTDPNNVIRFIEANIDLTGRTDGVRSGS